MSVHGVEKRSRAMQQRHERQGQRSMLIGIATKLRGQTALQEFKRRHVLFAGEGDGPIFRDEAEIVGIGSKKVQNALADLRGSARGSDSRKEISARPAPQEGDQVALVTARMVRACSPRLLHRRYAASRMRLSSRASALRGMRLPPLGSLCSELYPLHRQRNNV